MNRSVPLLLALGLLLSGCNETTTGPGTPPAPPRGLFSITGDEQVRLVWVANSEPDLAGYRIYEASLEDGPDGPYTRIGALDATPGTDYEEYVVTGLVNGRTRYFAVSAVDRGGAESQLSLNDVYDTPRPAGTDLVLYNYLAYTSDVGYDFSAFVRTDTTWIPSDIFYGYYEEEAGDDVYVHQQIFVPDLSTDIQDAGYVTSLDAVDFSPEVGWSPTGSVEAIVGHAYVVWTRDNHYAKFRVTAVGPGFVQMDWAYQTDLGNRELRARLARQEGTSQRRPIVWLRG